MNNLAMLAQPGVLTNPTSHVEYLTFVLKDQWFNMDEINDALSQLPGIEKSIRQKDPSASLTMTMGFSDNAWPMLFPDLSKPKELHTFPEMNDGERRFPSTAGDIFIMVKSERKDLNFQVAKHVAKVLSSIAALIEDIQGYKYLDNRDMIDFVDGTENPIDEERIASVLISEEDTFKGGSYLIVQRYVDKQGAWDTLSTEHQEKVVGRTKMDDIELDDDAKPAWAHNAKSKVEIDGEEVKMFRQNRPYGNAMEHGTMFVGFANTPSIIETSLTQMITADENGDYDKLLDFVEAKTGNSYFIPSQSFIDERFDD
ncbi:Dyp-type peroxidase [Enterovibrio nigricans]|uniref:Putative iron-dependent peroxidase n=1 Tax=Enterovibrio nigricans DSM 22720 TaxID=1121868 RepID=A0A1T4UHN9_9GAMM|nr:Dyp-type peroxidase [Enterovibrio nigricans]PKF50417.1 peroxidase [Enterovibrio nigricans]SKA52312.1 putative iron-dependent peroxidase [Enterovibrio nigricans DSM 22720]